MVCNNPRLGSNAQFDCETSTNRPHKISQPSTIDYGSTLTPSKVEVNANVLDNLGDPNYTYKLDIYNNIHNSMYPTAPLSMGDYIQPPLNRIKYKYSEDRIIKDFTSYIDATYSEHYSNEYENIQCFDAWIARGDSTSTFTNTAMKYLWRYGKKDGNNKKDLMKALHYVLLAMHVDHYRNK